MDDVTATVDGEPDQGHDARPDICAYTPDGRHELRCVGYLRGRRPEGMDCARPLQLVCRRCAARVATRCQTRHEGRCSSCSKRYRRRLTRLAEYGTSLPGRRRGSLGMLTITAPGTTPGHLRVIPEQIYTRGQTRPVCGCEATLDDRGVAGWNATTARRWNHLRTLLRRHYPGLEFCKSTEVQHRGALHVHVILWSAAALDLELVHRLVLVAGFGCSIDWSPCEPGRAKATYYIAKYVTKDAEPALVPWDEEVLNEHTGELVQITRAHFRPWTASRGWGLTMRDIRAATRRAAHAAAAAHRSAGPDAPPQDDGNPDRWLGGGGGLPPPPR